MDDEARREMEIEQLKATVKRAQEQAARAETELAKHIAERAEAQKRAEAEKKATEQQQK